MKTVSEVEIDIQTALDALRKLPLSAELRVSLKYLLPDGLQPVVQLEEDGRKKRSSAAISNWNPTTGEIRIYFDPIITGSSDTPSGASPDTTEAPVAQSHVAEPADARISALSASAETPAEPVSSQEIVECCKALHEAEKSNRQFISLKWFRDDYLPTVDFSWTASAQSRQRVLGKALDMGKIQTKKIANPRSSFPTTAINLNRAIPTPGVAPRFQPITVHGEMASTTLLRDRG